MKTITLISALLLAPISIANNISPLSVMIEDSNSYDRMNDYQVKNIITLAQATNKARQLSNGILSSIDLEISSGIPIYNLLFQEAQDFREISIIAENGEIYQNQVINMTTPTPIQNIDLSTAIKNAEQELQAKAFLASFIDNGEVASYEVILLKNETLYSVIVSAETGKVLVVSKDNAIAQEYQHTPNSTSAENISLGTATDTAEQLIAGKAIFSFISDGLTKQHTITVDVMTDKAITSVLINSLNGNVINTKSIEDQHSLSKISKQQKIISIEKASMIARSTKAGQFISAELFIEENQPFYSVNIVRNSTIHHVKINAVTGDILEVHEEVVGEIDAI